jgi:holliday junction DNA helicase RuvA
MVMIAYLHGTLLETAEHSCVALTSGGVGYEVFLPTPLLARLPAQGEEVSFHTYTLVREDALELYGFDSRDERDIFGTLLSISKLGPKTSLALLSLFPPDELRRVAAGEDPDVLTRVSGIGKKTAQHIFLELKYKLKAGTIPGAASVPGDKGAAVFRDALAGLVNLGYAEEEARSVLEQVFRDEPDLDVAQALRQTLKHMAKSRE